VVTPQYLWSRRRLYQQWQPRRWAQLISTFVFFIMNKMLFYLILKIYWLTMHSCNILVLKDLGLLSQEDSIRESGKGRPVHKDRLEIVYLITKCRLEIVCFVILLYEILLEIIIFAIIITLEGLTRRSGQGRLAPKNKLEIVNFLSYDAYDAFVLYKIEISYVGDSCLLIRCHMRSSSSKAMLNNFPTKVVSCQVLAAGYGNNCYVATLGHKSKLQECACHTRKLNCNIIKLSHRNMKAKVQAVKHAPLNLVHEKSHVVNLCHRNVVLHCSGDYEINLYNTAKIKENVLNENFHTNWWVKNFPLRVDSCQKMTAQLKVKVKRENVINLFHRNMRLIFANSVIYEIIGYKPSFKNPHLYCLKDGVHGYLKNWRNKNRNIFVHHASLINHLINDG